MNKYHKLSSSLLVLWPFQYSVSFPRILDLFPVPLLSNPWYLCSELSLTLKPFLTFLDIQVLNLAIIGMWLSSILITWPRTYYICWNQDNCAYFFNWAVKVERQYTTHYYFYILSTFWSKILELIWRNFFFLSSAVFDWFSEFTSGCWWSFMHVSLR